MAKTAVPPDHTPGLTATGNCVELICVDPMSFSDRISHKFDPKVLPRLDSTYTEGITVTFWIMVQKRVQGWNVIFHCGPDPHRTPATWFHSNSTRVHVRATTRSSTNEGSDSKDNVFDLNKWHHAAYVLEDTLLLFYVDCNVVMAHVLAGNPIFSDGTHPFFIGHDTQHTSFNGLIKHFRVYGFALSKAQLKKDKSSLEPLRTEPVHAKVSAYESLVDNPTHSDVTFLVNGTRVYGHKCILVASSQYFKRLLGGSMKESSMKEITIDGVSVEMFIVLMKYLYAGRVPSDPQDAIKLMVTADYFSTDSKLTDRCKDTLGGKLTTANACQLLSIADRFVNQESLVRMIMSFMSSKENYAKLIDSDELYQLPQPLLRKFLKFSSVHYRSI